MARCALVVVGVLLASTGARVPTSPDLRKLDPALRVEAAALPASVRVIVQTGDAPAVERTVRRVGGRVGRRLNGGRALVAEVASGRLRELTGSSAVRSVRLDRRIEGALERAGISTGARWVQENLGIDGAGIGIAIIDSGVTSAHDDLGPDRVVHFANFVDLQPEPHDGYGHGTHVAGILAGSGFDSGGARRGIAPGAHLVVLKALDGHGDGFISNAIAALDYAVDHRLELNIRVINLSVAAGVYESYKTDPLTLAARRAVEAGIVVVTAAGNLGRDSKGMSQYGGITAPGNAPWVLTVGAASHNGTPDPADDTVAPFSSMGPSSIDLVEKPDLVAPGVGIESLADRGSSLFRTRPAGRVWGTVPTDAEPYLSLSGTSMAAPVVAGTVALMVQANPALTPEAVKGVLLASASRHEDESPRAQGAGFLNARAAVELARAFSDIPAAVQLLEDLAVAYTSQEGAWTAPCRPGDAACRLLAGDCGRSRNCFGGLFGAMTGAVSPMPDTTVWTARAQRHRAALRSGRTVNPGVNE